MEVHCMLSRPEGMGGNNDSEGQNHSRSRKPKQVRQLKLALGPRSSDLVACGLGTDELFGHSYANGVGDCKEEVSVSIIPISASLPLRYYGSKRKKYRGKPYYPPAWVIFSFFVVRGANLLFISFFEDGCGARPSTPLVEMF